MTIMTNGEKVNTFQKEGPVMRWPGKRRL